MTAFLEGLHGEMLERWSPVVEWACTTNNSIKNYY